jgi:hypothetical protein
MVHLKLKAKVRDRLEFVKAKRRHKGKSSNNVVLHIWQGCWLLNKLNDLKTLEKHLQKASGTKLFALDDPH